MPQQVGLPSRTLLLLSVALVCGAALQVASHQEFGRELAKSLMGLRVDSLAGAFLLGVAQVGFQSLRFWAAVSGDTLLPVVEAAHVFTLGDWTNVFAPARGGDVLKAVLMKRAGGGQSTNLPRAVGAVLADKIVDLGSMLLLCAITGSLSNVAAEARAPRVDPVLAMSGAGLVALLVAIVRARPTWLAKLKDLSRQLLQGLSTLKHPARCLISVSFGVGAWAAEALALRVLAAGLGFSPSPAQLVFAIVLLNIGTAVPVSVASLGVYEASLAYGLSRSGLPLPSAIVVATAHHALQLLGLGLCTAALSLRIHALRRGTRQPGPP